MDVAERQKVVHADFHQGVVAREGVEKIDDSFASLAHPLPDPSGVRPPAGDFGGEAAHGVSETLHALDQRRRKLPFAQLPRARRPRAGGPEGVGRRNARPDLDQALAQAQGQRVVKAGGETAVLGQPRLDAHAVQNFGHHVLLGDDRSHRLAPREEGDLTDNVALDVARDGQGVAAV